MLHANLPSRSSRRGRAWAFYLIGSLLVSASYFVLPKGEIGQAVVFVAIEVISIGAIVAGVRWWRPAKPAFWYLLGAGQLIYLAGNATWYLYPVGLHGVLPYPSVADALFITSYIVSGVALALLTRSRSTGAQSRADLIDTAIIGLGLASVSWTFLIAPALNGSTLGLAGQLTSIAYPLLDITLLSLAIRLAVTPGARMISHWLVLLWIAGQFAADSAFAATTLSGAFSYGDLTFAGWLLSFVFIGSAALHPSMRDLTQPSMARPELAGRVRLVLLAGAALIPVALILLDILRGKPEHHFVLASTAGALIVLVTLRLSGLMVDIAEHHRVQLELEQEIAVRQAAEGRLQQQTEALQRSNAELEQFAYVASHDLQEPLRMVASYAGLLKRRYAGKLDAEADEFIDYAMDGVTRMRALINDLLTYSRVGREERPAESTDSRVALDRALANLEVAIADRQALVVIGNLPTVMASSLQLTQVFQNLIGNGLKFCRETRPEIRVDAERRGAEWIFAVRDNGIGIDPQYKDRIFLIFQRLHKRDEYEGTGIGLAICKKIVERQGGRIWIESEPGKGATFRFTLRAMHALAAAA